MKETLEEAALKWFVTANKHDITFGIGWINIFKQGAKWCKEQYTTEEQHIEHSINDLDKEYIKGFNEGAEWQKQEMYTIMQEYAEFCIGCDRREMPLLLVNDWIEHFKK